MTTTVLSDVLSWAWDRHTNILSWYVRPLFMVPLAWAAYRRRPWGIAATIVALLTSMAWFPAPAVPDPMILGFIAFEREWLTGGWPLDKILVTLLVPLSLAAYCVAFWRRSLVWGLVVLNGIALGKVLWSVLAGGDSGWAAVVPALAGLAVGDLAVLAAARRLRHRSATADAKGWARA